MLIIFKRAFETQIFFKFVSVVAFDSNNCIAIYEFDCDCNNFITLQTITPANSLIRSQHFVVEELQQTNCILLYLYGLLKICFFLVSYAPKTSYPIFIIFLNLLMDYLIQKQNFDKTWKKSPFIHIYRQLCQFEETRLLRRREIRMKVLDLVSKGIFRQLLTIMVF